MTDRPVPWHKRRSRRFWIALWIVSVIAAQFARTLVPTQYAASVTVAAAVVLFVFLMVILVKNAGAMARTVKAWRAQL